MNRPLTVSLHVLAFCLLTAVCSCDKDEDDTPAYVVELVEAYSDGNKAITSVRLDNGQTYDVGQGIAASNANRTYRCLCTYRLDGDGIYIYSLLHVFSLEPYHFTMDLSFMMNPVKFYSCWKTDRYLNLRVGVMTSGNGTHSFLISEDTTYTVGDKQVACFTLLHARPEKDTEAYTEEAFICMPTSGYQDFDTLIINVPTYDGTVQIKK